MRERCSGEIREFTFLLCMKLSVFLSLYSPTLKQHLMLLSRSSVCCRALYNSAEEADRVECGICTDKKYLVWCGIQYIGTDRVSGLKCKKKASPVISCLEYSNLRIPVIISALSLSPLSIIFFYVCSSEYAPNNITAN